MAQEAANILWLPSAERAHHQIVWAFANISNVAHTSFPPKSWSSKAPSSMTHRPAQTVMEDKSSICLNYVSMEEVFSWILHKTTVTRSLTIPLSSARSLSWSLFQSCLPENSVFLLVLLFALVSVYSIVAEGCNLARQSLLLTLCVYVHMCVYTCALLEKKLAYYPATGIKQIYPQVWNLLFLKLFGENKCLYLITWSSISISL